MLGRSYADAVKRGVRAGLVTAGCGGLVAGLLAFDVTSPAPTVVYSTLSTDRATSFQVFGDTVQIPAHAVDRGTTATVAPAHPAAGSPFGDLAVAVGPAVRVDFGTARLHRPATVTTPDIAAGGHRQLAFMGMYESSARGWRVVPTAMHGGRLSGQLTVSATVRTFVWRPAALADRIVSKLGERSRPYRASCPHAPRDAHVIVQNPYGPAAPPILACVERIRGGLADVAIVNRSGIAYDGDCCEPDVKVLSKRVDPDAPEAIRRQAREAGAGGMGGGLGPYEQMRVRLPVRSVIAFWSRDDYTLREALAATATRQLSRLTLPPFACTEVESGSLSPARRVARCIDDLNAFADNTELDRLCERCALPVSWARALGAALEGSSVADALGTPANAGAAQFTVIRASDHQLAEPVLGTHGLPDGGLGLARPDGISFGGDEGSFVLDVHWTTWGGPRAMGTGTANWWGPQTRSMSTTVPEPATVVAYDLGRCHGRPAYRKVTWYFPQFGEKFRADNGRWGICGRGYYAIS